MLWAFTVKKSCRNKLPFIMILNARSNLQENGFSCRNLHFPTEKCIFLQKNAFFCRKTAYFCRKTHLSAGKWVFLQKDGFSYRKNAFSYREMHFPAEKCGFRAARGRKPQDTAGWLPGSRIKSASQLSQEEKGSEKGSQKRSQNQKGFLEEGFPEGA